MYLKLKATIYCLHYIKDNVNLKTTVQKLQYHLLSVTLEVYLNNLFKIQKDMALQIKIQIYRKDFTITTLLFNIYL